MMAAPTERATARGTPPAQAPSPSPAVASPPATSASRSIPAAVAYGIGVLAAAAAAFALPARALALGVALALGMRAGAALLPRPPDLAAALRALAFACAGVAFLAEPTFDVPYHVGAPVLGGLLVGAGIEAMARPVRGGSRVVPAAGAVTVALGLAAAASALPVPGEAGPLLAAGAALAIALPWALRSAARSLRPDRAPREGITGFLRERFIPLSIAGLVAVLAAALWPRLGVEGVPRAIVEASILSLVALVGLREVGAYLRRRAKTGAPLPPYAHHRQVVAAQPDPGLATWSHAFDRYVTAGDPEPLRLAVAQAPAMANAAHDLLDEPPVPRPALMPPLACHAIAATRAAALGAGVGITAHTWGSVPPLQAFALGLAASSLLLLTVPWSRYGGAWWAEAAVGSLGVGVLVLAERLWARHPLAPDVGDMAVPWYASPYLLAALVALLPWLRGLPSQRAIPSRWAVAADEADGAAARALGDLRARVRVRLVLLALLWLCLVALAEVPALTVPPFGGALIVFTAAAITHPALALLAVTLERRVLEARLTRARARRRTRLAALASRLERTTGLPFLEVP